MTQQKALKTWMGIPAAHSHAALMRLGSKKSKKKPTVSCFSDSQENSFIRNNNAPITKGLRLDLEMEPDGSIKR